MNNKQQIDKTSEEINGVMEQLLEEDEMDLTDINNLIYAAATIITQTLNELGKRITTRKV